MKLPPIDADPGDIARGLFELPTQVNLLHSQAIANRNKLWGGNDYIPGWVDVSQVELDRFFTNPDVAKQCYLHLMRTLESDYADLGKYVFVEPGAGNGAFYDLLPGERRIGIDIVQSNPEYVPTDFLSWRPKEKGRQYVIVGNPPFGYRGWLALSFVNHAATFADYIGMILPMSFQSDGKGSPKHRVIGAELIQHESLPDNAFTNERGQSVKLNALWQVWRRGVNNKQPAKCCDQWIDLFTVDHRKERLCGQERLHEANWFLQRTFFGNPPKLVKDFSQVKYGCGYGIVAKKHARKLRAALNKVDWRKYSNLAMHNCCHISMYHIRNAMIDAGFVDV